MFVLPFKKNPSRKQRRGFSLVVALVMMALMLLIAISLVSFVVLESQLCGYKVKRYQAQANAICGLRIALAQLQLLTGDDQRVTATADILEQGGSNNASLPSGTAYKGKRHWTGVWATGGLDKTDQNSLRDWDYTEPDKKPFLGWLVSGYDEDKENYSPFEQAVAKTSIDADKGKELVKEATSAYDVEDSSTELITLVGAGTLGKKDGWEEEVVKVRRVPLEKRTDFQQAQKSSGSFAYWVGDEGVKARVNLADNYSQAFDSSLKDWHRTLRASPQRVGTEAMEAFKSFEDWWADDTRDAGNPKASRLPYVLSIGDLAAYGDEDSSEFLKEARSLYHDVSFYSRGVFSDVYSGGLKTDLSVAFEMPWFGGESGWDKGFRDYPQFHGSQEKNEMNLLSDFDIPNDETTKWWTTQPEDGLGYVYEFDTKKSSYSAGKTNVKNVEILRGPTWDLFRNYYRLYKREIEKKGLRGLKPSDDKNWLATGMAPYSYVSGEQGRRTTSTTITVGDQTLTFKGIFCPKSNFSRLTNRASGFDQYGDDRMFLPQFSGKTFTADADGTPTGGALIPQAMRLSPMLIRSVLRFAVVFNQDTAAVVFDPSMVIHNPYSVPIEFFGFGSYFTKFYPLTLRFNRTDGGVWKYYKNRNRNESSYTESTSMSIDFLFYTDNVYGVLAHSLRIFAGTTDYNNPPNGSIVLQPGEIRAVFPNSATKPLKMQTGYGLTASLGGFEYEEYSNSSLELPLAWDKMTEADQNISFSIDVGPSSVPGETEITPYYLFYPKNACGNSGTDRQELKRTWNSIAAGDGQDGSDETFVQCVGLPRRTVINEWHNNFAGKTFSRTGESGYEHAQKQFILDYDMYRVAAEDSPLGSPLYSNHRPWVLDPRFWESDLIDAKAVSKKNYTNAGIGWAVELRPNSNDFSPIEHNDGNAFWGDSLTSASGQSNVVLFDVPTRPITSLGQLQNVDCSVADGDPSYVVGNSYASVAIKDLNKLFDWPENTNLGVSPRSDTPFAANLTLFDRYFFSGINFGDIDGQESNIISFANKLLRNEANPLASQRVSFIRNRLDQERTDDVVREELKDPNKVARNFLYEGMFNVNSTSVEAWKAQLASLHKQYLSIDGDYKEVEDFPIVRFMNIVGQKAGGNGQGVNDGSGDEGEGWRWYRSLSDKDIEELAEKIVEEVRLRGPFMSMADFVNRRLNSTADSALSGTLQSAIDKTNRINQSLGTARSTPDSKYFPNQIPANRPSRKPGAPGYLTQGDILSSLGAGMAVRSDTFTIRAYGDVFGLSGTPEARAYCEAVVQRLPDWVAEEEDSVLENADKTLFDALQVKKNYRNQNLDADEHFFEKFERNVNLKAVNRLLGRRYKIISFRWLSPDEI